MRLQHEASTQLTGIRHLEFDTFLGRQYPWSLDASLWDSCGQGVTRVASLVVPA